MIRALDINLSPGCCINRGEAKLFCGMGASPGGYASERTSAYRSLPGQEWGVPVGELAATTR
jgi:hypothetical protein